MTSERTTWLWGACAALIGHIAVLGGVLSLGVSQPKPVVEDPVVFLELPPQAPAASASMAQQPVERAMPEIAQPTTVRPPVEAPKVRVPLPREIVAVSPAPTPPPLRNTALLAEPVAAPQPSRPAPAVVTEGSDKGASTDAGSDPEAKRQEANYYALLSAHLNRKKRYPSEAKKARQEGVVTVRFTVLPDGRIRESTIRKSSGHALLDQATLDLMQRVTPLPKFPRSMTKSSVTISLPIDYSLRTS